MAYRSLMENVWNYENFRKGKQYKNALYLFLHVWFIQRMNFWRISQAELESDMEKNTA